MINNYKKYSLFSLLLLVTGICLTPETSIAAGQLMISPSRVVFDGNMRSEQITLINSGSETGRYRISFIRQEMTDNGAIKTINDDRPGNYSDEMIRFSPRQVTLPPGKTQTIRLMLRKPANLEDGEYRSHMMFQSIPDPSTTDITTLTTDNKDIKIQLIPIVGITIPVIVRSGELSATVTLSDFELHLSNEVKPQPQLTMNIHREGTSSVYGDIRVYFTPKMENAETISVGQVNGIALYTPNEKRSFELTLQPPAAYNLSNGELHIKYIKPGEDEQTGLHAEAKVIIP